VITLKQELEALTAKWRDQGIDPRSIALRVAAVEQAAATPTARECGLADNAPPAAPALQEPACSVANSYTH
jgi:hypothetical protein